VLLREQLDEHVLDLVGVLVLVDHDVLEAPLPFLQRRGVLAEEPGCDQEHVVEVESTGVAEELVVDRVDARDDLREVVLGLGGELVWPKKLVLGMGDAPGDGLRREFLLVQVELLHRPLDGSQPIGLVVDDVAAVDADQVAVAAQDATADGVEGAHPHRRLPRADQGFDARAHLSCGLVGERHRQDLVGVGSARPDQVRDPVGEHPGLAAAGTGKDQQWSVWRGDRLQLRRVEDCRELGGVQGAQTSFRRRGLRSARSRCTGQF